MIIGNPPWKEYSAVKKAYHVRDYQTEGSGNLYALCAERSLALLAPRGLLSFIVQLPLVSSSRMQTMRQFLRDRAIFLAAVTCDDRPGKLFDGLQHCRSTVFVAQRGNNGGKSELWTSGYRRWASEVREYLFDATAFCPSSGGPLEQGQFPKLASLLQVSAFCRLFAPENRPVELRTCSRPTTDYVFYQESAQYWVKATVGLPYYAKDGCVGAPAHGRYLYFEDKAAARTACAILNSSLFYVYYITYGDCFHVSNALAGGLPVPRTVWEERALADLGVELMSDLTANAQRKTINTRDGSEITYAEFRVNESKPIIDKIDMLLGKHYGFSPAEMDFIINYDIKYRMGGALEDDDPLEDEE